MCGAHKHTNSLTRYIYIARASDARIERGATNLFKTKKKKKPLEVENNIRTAAKVAAAAVAVAAETNANSILHKRISVAPYLRSTEHDCV